MCAAKGEVSIPTSAESAHDEWLKEEVVSHSSKEGDSSKPDSKAALTSEEKMKLLSLYGCESDEEEYPCTLRRKERE